VHVQSRRPPRRLPIRLQINEGSTSGARAAAGDSRRLVVRQCRCAPAWPVGCLAARAHQLVKKAAAALTPVERLMFIVEGDNNDRVMGSISSRAHRRDIQRDLGSMPQVTTIRKFDD
jgi:hypothetical protein